MDVLLALDAGTTGIRAVAYSDQLETLTTSYRELTQYFPAPGLVEHDVHEIGRLALDVLSEVARTITARGDRVRALGITNQRETTILFDRADGVAPHRALVWQDRRTASTCDDLRERGALELVRARSGLVLDPYFSGTKMRWLLDHVDVSAMQRPALATVDAYLVWLLTGESDGGVFATEASNASRTMLMDIETLDWSGTLSTLLGVDASLLPTIRPSVGHFGDVVHEELVELRGVPITGVLGDQQSAMFGQACFTPGTIKATYGTGSFVLAHAGHRAPAPVDGLIATVAWDLGAYGETAYAYEGSAFVAGAAVQWLRDELAFMDHASELEALARSVPDAGGVRFVPSFTGLGSPFWRAEARGAIMGLTRGSNRAHVARALVDALAFQVRAMTDAFAAAGVSLHELRADGGAAAMDDLMTLQATASRLRVRRSASVEATARGAASAAGLGAGVVDSLDELSERWRATFSAEPGDPTIVDVAYEAWLRAVAMA